MILTCPTCATRYLVGEDAVPAGGRTVRCASCGGSWRAEPAAPAEAPALELAPAPAPPPAATPAAPAFGRGGEAPVSKAFREQAQERRRTRHAVAAGVAWAAVSAAAVVLVLLAVLFRVQVVRLIPRTAGVYAALKLPVNPTGLALDGVQGQPGLMDGRAVLAVTGLERNVEARPRPASSLRVSLYDKAGRPAATQLVRLDPLPIPPGETRPFRAVFADPPLSATEFGVELAFDLPPAPPSAPAPRATAVRSAQAGPPPAPAAPVREAQPLPASSPYALPAAAVSPHG